MAREEKTWTLRITLEAEFADDGDDPAEDFAWLETFRARGPASIVRTAFEALRSAGLEPRVLSRGRDPEDEIEILAHWRRPEP